MVFRFVAAQKVNYTLSLTLQLHFVSVIYMLENYIFSRIFGSLLGNVCFVRKILGRRIFYI